MVDAVSIRIHIHTIGSYLAMSFLMLALFQGIFMASNGTTCITYLGLKAFCSQMEPTTNLLDVALLCDIQKSNINIAQSFHYCALFFSAAAAVMNILANAGRMPKFQLPSYLCGAIVMVSTILCWIMLATVQQMNLCRTGSLRDWGWYLGSGFALVVCASFFQCVGTTTSVLLYHLLEGQPLLPELDTNEEEEAKEMKQVS
jgi:hypothetical protein